MPASVFVAVVPPLPVGVHVSEQRPHSPCIGVCRFDAQGHCLGCLRERAEVVAWAGMDLATRQACIDGPLATRRQQLRPFSERLAERSALRRVLHPTDRPPQGPGWNHAQLAGLLPPQPPHEAAVLVGLVPRPAGTTVLLTRRTDNLRHHGGQVGFPGGRIEASDLHPAAAALRESHEEIALLPAQAVALGFLDPFITISNYRVLPLVAVLDPEFVAVPSPDEVAEVFEVPLAFLMDMGNLQARPVEWAGQSRSVLEYTWPGQRIWGATAAMLVNLHQRLEQA